MDDVGSNDSQVERALAIVLRCPFDIS